MADLRGCFSSNSDEWATPQSLYDELNKEFDFNLDPCCTNENAKCNTHYTIEDNGLDKNWGGTECFATHHIARLISGLKRRSGKRETITHLLYC